MTVQVPTQVTTETKSKHNEVKVNAMNGERALIKPVKNTCNIIKLLSISNSKEYVLVAGNFF